MSISQALSNATSGLGAVSLQAGLVSQNIANALTPGFARRDIALAERTVAGEGAGVRVAGVIRASNPALTAERRIADGDTARDEARLSAAQKISALFGGPEDAGALFSRLSAFGRTLRDLSNQPSNGAALQAAAGAARQLVLGINDLAASLQSIRQSADQSIAADVQRVNVSLKQIEKLNIEIEKAVVGGRDASALIDERDRQVDVVNRAIPSRALIRENGRIDLITREGAILIAGEARQLTFRASAVITASQTLANGALSGLSVDGVDVTPGRATPFSAAGGSIAGNFAVRDEIAYSAAADLDAFVADLIERFAAPGVDPTAPAGAPGLFTDAGGSLSGGFAPGIATRLQLNAAVDPRQGGEAWRLREGVYAAAQGSVGSNAILINLVDAFDAPRATTFSNGAQVTAEGSAAGLAALRGATLSLHQSAATASAASRDILAEAELATIGVDTDAELQQLLVIEQAYAANARVIEVAARLLDRLTEL